MWEGERTVAYVERLLKVYPLICCRWLEHIFEAADKNGDDTLDLKEIIKLAKELNMGFSKRDIEKMFQVCDDVGYTRVPTDQ